MCNTCCTELRDLARSALNGYLSRVCAVLNCTRRTLFRCIRLVAALSVVTSCSLFTYASFHYWYVPEVLHVRDLNFLYETECSRNNGDFCNYPTENLTLIASRSNQLLVAGQKYVFLLHLELPESPTNQNLGLFISTIQLYTHSGVVLIESSRGSMLVYKSKLYRYVETLFFVYPMLFGVAQEKQTITVQLLSGYTELSVVAATAPPINASIISSNHFINNTLIIHTPTVGVFFTLKVKRIELYKATLKIHAQFSGLRYVMFYWPILSAFIGIPMNMFFYSVLMLIIWLSRRTAHRISEHSKEQYSAEISSTTECSIKDWQSLDNVINTNNVSNIVSEHTITSTDDAKSSKDQVVKRSGFTAYVD